MYIERLVQKSLEDKLFKHNIVIVYGPRQAGKTTLVQKILERFGSDGLYWNCEDPDISAILRSHDAAKIHGYLKGKRIVVLDEAQSVPRIGALLKLLFDTYPDIQYVATGSSSFELSQQVGEPLVGRSWEFIVYPFGLTEVTHDALSFEKALATVMVYGSYPEVFQLGNADKELKLKTIASQYLSKDILAFEGVRNSALLQDLLRLLAGQLGNEVSFNEIATILGTSRQTIIRYVDILEKSFVIFRLPAYARSVRGRVGRKFKVYFYDLGMRNALVGQFGAIDPLTRADVGALWENLCILERRKAMSYRGRTPDAFFWRDRGGEVDYLEEENGQVRAHECKWNDRRTATMPRAFASAVHPVSFTVLRPSTLRDFLDMPTA